jgi:DNA polymerase-3 subunit beta
MEIHCFKEDLFKGVQLVQNTLSSRSTLPILSNILFESNREGLRLSATDLEMGIRCQVKADIRIQGAITIPARPLNDFLRTLEEGQELSIKINENQKIEIRSGRDRCVLMGLSKDEYPILPELGHDRFFSLSSFLLREMLHKTSFAVSNDPSRRILNGVYLKINQGVIVLVATDGRRLATIQKPFLDPTSAAEIVIPIKVIHELEKILSEEKDAEVQMGFTENQVTFRYQNTTVISRLLEGSFPPFENLIPKNSLHKIKLNKKNFFLSTQRAAVGLWEKGGSVRLQLTDGKLQISAAALGRVEVESELEADYKGATFSIAFNPTYLTDVLRTIDADHVLLEITTPLNPGVLHPLGDDNHTYVIMPMHSNNPT